MKPGLHDNGYNKNGKVFPLHKKTKIKQFIWHYCENDPCEPGSVKMTENTPKLDYFTDTAHGNYLLLNSSFIQASYRQKSYLFHCRCCLLPSTGDNMLHTLDTQRWPEQATWQLPFDPELNFGHSCCFFSVSEWSSSPNIHACPLII